MHYFHLTIIVHIALARDFNWAAETQDFFKTVYMYLYGPKREKTCLQGFANNTGADQPAHPRSLISTFVIHF